MSKCDYCNHAEMCGWRKDVEEQGCEFFDDGNKWIPCEERLPEKGSRVIACDDEGGIDAIWYEKSFDKDICVWKDDYSIEWDGIVAWMPLPTPYMKGADDDAEEMEL